MIPGQAPQAMSIKSRLVLIRTLSASGIGKSLQLSKPPGGGLKLGKPSGLEGVSSGFDPGQKKFMIIGNATKLSKQENKFKDSDEDSDDDGPKHFGEQVVDTVNCV